MTRLPAIIFLGVWFSAAGFAGNPMDFDGSKGKPTTGTPSPSGTTELQTLIGDLQHPDNSVRLKAIKSLAGLGSQAKPAVPALADILKNKRAPFRVEVASAFNQILPPHVDMFQEFPELRYVGVVLPTEIWTEEQKSRLAEATRVANAEAAKAAAVAVPVLADCLKDDDASLREYAALSLGACGSLAREAIPVLILALKDEVEAVRVHASEALGRMGPDAKAAIPFLREYIKTRTQQRSELRQIAERAIDRMEAPNKADGGDGK